MQVTRGRPGAAWMPRPSCSAVGVAGGSGGGGMGVTPHAARSGAVRMPSPSPMRRGSTVAVRASSAGEQQRASDTANGAFVSMDDDQRKRKADNRRALIQRARCVPVAALTPYHPQYSAQRKECTLAKRVLTLLGRTRAANPESALEHCCLSTS